MGIGSVRVSLAEFRGHVAIALLADQARHLPVAFLRAIGECEVFLYLSVPNGIEIADAFV